MTEEKFTKKVNDRLEKLFDLYPIEDLRPSEVNEEMKAGLARLYADRGQRMYLENAVKIAIKNMSVAPTPLEINYYKSRIDCLEQLLAKGQQCFATGEVGKGLRDNATKKG